MHVGKGNVWWSQVFITAEDREEIAATMATEHKRWKIMAHRAFLRQCQHYVEEKTEWEREIHTLDLGELVVHSHLAAGHLRRRFDKWIEWVNPGDAVDLVTKDNNTEQLSELPTIDSLLNNEGQIATWRKLFPFHSCSNPVRL